MHDEDKPGEYSKWTEYVASRLYHTSKGDEKSIHQSPRL